MRALDIQAVQAFVLVADLASFTRAAEAMEATQSAVSLKIKKLEDDLGRRLFERTPRRVRLTAAGQLFLDRARQLIDAHGSALEAFATERRRLAVGISDHAVGAELPQVLQRVKRADPGLVLEMHVGSSRDLLAAFDNGALDAVIAMGQEAGRRGGEVLRTETFGWMAAPDFVVRPGDPLPLAAHSESCGMRSMGVTALDAAGIAWTEVFVGGGVGTIAAAVSAGLAVAVLSRRVAPPGLIDIGPALGLPALPTRDLVLYASLADPAARQSVKTLAAAIRATGN
ncbi:LysR family transcriptional regulator [uncultured Ferrovibrio sp.]|jgi:DNA-binding transcriptional LysR family regulator|uniref:LysR family transcriptional regulator n=1 Tax=uncultured Ferrovibrio sp. TaxID=1576913 RepID=UPI0026242401|nr:LysR family transcriptional regulator [uncultured Ferrovibrio sp.]